MAAPPASSPTLPAAPSGVDDIVLALALTTRWMLFTGRRLDCAVPLFHDLSPDELIEFWSDDQLADRASDAPGGLVRDERPDDVDRRTAPAWLTYRAWKCVGAARSLRHVRHRHRRVRHSPR